MYLRKIRPRTTCLYSAASMLLRSLSAASQSLASKPMLALELFFEEERVRGMEEVLPCSCKEAGEEGKTKLEVRGRRSEVGDEKSKNGEFGFRNAECSDN